MSGSKIRLLGTGTAFHPDGRGSQSILVEPIGGGPFVVDLGPSSASQMSRFGVDPAALDRLFVTHLHGDHTAGWPFLLLNLQLIAARRRPFHVHGPTGVRPCLEGLVELCYGALLAPARLDFELRYAELAVDEAPSVPAGALRFDVLPMEHHPSSLGYRFHLGDGRRLAVSGDTRWCPNLERLARDSDLLLVECSSREEQAAAAHVSLAELRLKRGRLDTRRIVLVHLSDEVAAELAIDPIAGVVAGHDGMFLEL